MIAFLKRLFFPTRFDACCVVIVMHWLSVILLVTLIPIFAALTQMQLGVESVNAVAAATWIAVASSWCWRGHSKQRVVLLLASSIACLVFAQAWFWMNPDIVGNLEPHRPIRGFTVQTGILTFFGQREIVSLSVLLSVAVLLLSFLFRFVVGKVAGKFRSLADKLPADRTRGLVFAAGILFLVSVIFRIQPNLGIEFSDNQFGVAEFGFNAAVFSIVWLVVLAWFPYSWSASGKPVQKAITLVMVLAAFVIAAINIGFGPGLFALALAAPVFIGTVIGIGGCRVESAGSETQPAFIKPAFRVFRPSLLSLATVLVLGFAILVQQLIGTGLLVGAFAGSSRIGVATGWELVELMKKSASARWNSGGRIELVCDPQYFAPTWKVRFDEAAPSDLLASLPSTGVMAVELDGMTPEFDASLVPAGTSIAIIKDCRLTHSQIEQLLATVSEFEIKGSLSTVDDGHTVDPGVIGSIYINDAVPGAAKKFLDATNCDSQLTRLFFGSPITNEDWSAIEDASQFAQVYIQGGWDPDFKLPKTQQSLGTVSCFTPVGAVDSDLEKELLLYTDINLNSTDLRATDAEAAWKLTMLRGLTGVQSFEYLLLESSKSIDEFAKELGMAYEVEDGKVRSLYFPSSVGVEQIANLEDLRVLSFDPGWVKPGGNIAYFGGIGTPESLDHLHAITSLEELYFGARCTVGDLAILSKLTSLKHLQIPAAVRSVTGPVGFDDCPTLESITFFGAPDNKSWNEVSRLPKLKRLTIIDHESDETLTPEFIAKVKKKLPGVEVSVHNVHKNETLIPKAFREYRDRLRKELRADTKWLDDLLNKN